MSPQQLRELSLDHQTDIYSLSVVMYQSLTSQLPFQASTSYNIIHQIINIKPTQQSAIRKNIPKVLDAMVARAMSKETRQHYQTWKEFSHDLARAFRNKELKVPQCEFAESEKFHTLRDLLFFNDFSDIEL